ncbi:hypothetical protein BZA05DRAFT_2687 [Tricharina praecox]|uniref:uncharacterized protein n=1 Tax=Tricharina praecox TaxID=43433 RepID=UPI002220A35D|nr:uncharacterized protein BZA05DRAFT_2687 [Tricharina praecox]KAI5858418.1 hypothetical protein BZA05DRAFT_2687 [Tricharina praecox]
MHPTTKALTSTTAIARAAASTTMRMSYSARTSRLTAAGLAACRNPPPPPHAPRTSLPPFRAPPLTPVFEIRGRGFATSAQSAAGNGKNGNGGSNGGKKSGGSSTSSPEYKAAERKVRIVIIALPVVFVTSWVLYQRCLSPPSFSSVFYSFVSFFSCLYLLAMGLIDAGGIVVLGEERKVLPRGPVV